jgi:hypothetical protein
VPPADRPGSQGGGPPDGVPAQRPGRLVADAGQADGRYINFSYDPAGGSLSDYAVGGTVFFATVDAPDAFEFRIRGGTADLQGEGFYANVHDNPTGLLRLVAQDGTFVLTLGPDVDATANGSRVDLAAGNASAVVTNATLSGDSLTATEALFMLRGPSVSAVARSANPSQALVEEAILNGHVAARIQVLGNGTDVLAYQDANVTSHRLQNGSHRVIVDANFTSGRAFVMDITPGLVRAEELGVLYYDEDAGDLVPAKIQRADSVSDALESTEGEGPEYYVVTGLDGAQVIVSVPRFSIHAFEVFAIPPEVAPLIVYGLVLGILVVGLMAVGAMVGRRDA